ncbi:MAG: DUF4399 domain-containing protein [Thermoflavifilum sp.]|nr:DUF4399 domain-containing protein [Thermoflavifilum sp.]
MKPYICTVLAIGLFAIASSCHHNTQQAQQSSTPASTPSVTQVATPALPAVPAGAKVFFKNLKDGEVVHSPFTVEMGVEGMQVDSAGPVKPGSGHHHLLIDDGDSIATGEVIPKDSTHLHFGNAQTQVVLNLPPGKHKLTLQFADGMHRSYGSQMATSITVQVK